MDATTLNLGHMRIGGQRNTIDVLQQLLAIRGKDSENMTVVEISNELLRHSVRTHMNRHMLLAECRKYVPRHVPFQGPNTMEAVSASHASGNKESKKSLPTRRPDVAKQKTPPGLASSSTVLNRSTATTPFGLSIQLRDIRCLLSISEPALFIRRGAMVVSFGAVRGVVTAERAFFLLPPDEPVSDLRHFSSLSPLLSKLHEEPADKQVGLPFELMVLEAVLLSSSELYMALVDKCSRDSQALLRLLRKTISPSLLNEVYTLKGAVANVLLQVSGAREVLERVQKDDTQMALMNLTEMSKDPEGYDRLLLHGSCYTEHVEVLLDSYALEVESLETKLVLINKQIDATEDLLRLRLESIQKNTFIANAFFHMILTLIGIPTCVTALWGSNLWSGYKFHLAGPSTAGINYKAPDYPVTQYDEDPNLGVSWIFLYNSVGLVLVVLLLMCLMICYVRYKGLYQIRVQE